MCFFHFIVVEKSAVLLLAATVHSSSSSSSFLSSKTEFGRPDPGPNDVDIKIAFCGICHSDVHATNGDWGMDNFPMAPGHEIAGTIQRVGSNVTNFKVGDRVGVGCFVDSCRECAACKRGEQNYCRQQVQTYSSQYPEGKGHDECAGYHTNGGYSTQITVAEDFVYHVPVSYVELSNVAIKKDWWLSD